MAVRIWEVVASVVFATVVIGPGCSDGQTPVGEADTDEDSGTDSDADTDADSDTDTDTGEPECGNDVTEGDEVCDDGNLVSGDGCNSTCTLKDGLDLVANTILAGDQRQPALACSSDRVALAFSDWNGADLSGAGVMLRLFGSDGMPIVNYSDGDEEFVANTETIDHQSEPRIALQPSGSFVIVWTDQSNDADTGTDVRFRVFQPDGNSLMSDALIGASATGEQATPAVAVAEDGSFMAVWTDNSANGSDLSGYGIKARLFDVDGVPKINQQTFDDAEFQINQIVQGNQIQPDVVWLGDRFLVVWADGSGSLDPDGFGVVGAVFDIDGTPIGPETEVLLNTATAGLQATPRAAVQPGQGAIVVWTDDSQSHDVSHYGIRGRLLDDELAGRQNEITSTAGDFQLNTVMNAGQMLPVPAVTSDGSFVVIWQDWSAEDGSGASIRGRMFSADAAPLATALALDGEDFQVNTTFWNAQLTPVICATGDWFFASWEDQSAESTDESGSAVRYRLLPGP